MDKKTTNKGNTMKKVYRTYMCIRGEVTEYFDFFDEQKAKDLRDTYRMHGFVSWVGLATKGTP